MTSGKALMAAFAFAIAAGSLLAAPASAEDRWQREHRAEAWREHERHREWHAREYHPYAYAPPPVVYAPPVQAPALNFVIPLHIH